MAEETLLVLNPWWNGSFPPPGVPRKDYINRISSHLDIQSVVIVHGLRRVGKSTILKQMIATMVDELGNGNVFYASLDHPKIKGLSIIDVLAKCRSITKSGRDPPQLLVLDEVQHREGFEWEIKALTDSEDNLKIVAAGSSSLVGRHKSSAMTGRYMKLHIHPLDFSEYLLFKDVDYDLTEPDRMKGFLEDHLKEGGMPQYVLTGEPQVLLNILEDVVYKDVVKEFAVRDPNKLNELVVVLIDRIGKPLSFRKTGRLIDMGNDATARYVDFLHQTYLFDLCERHGSPNERRYNNKKVYCADNGMRVVLSGSSGKGALAENLVFEILNRMGEPRYFIKDKREVDFIVNDMAVEVKYKDALTSEDLENLIALKVRGVKRKFVITRTAVETPQSITCIPLWRLAAEGVALFE